MSLQQNPEPIKIVPAAQRDVWQSKPEHRCYHEDGRGRCRRYDTRVYRMQGTPTGVEWYCDAHAPDWDVPGQERL